jgi:hypothetical protein
MLRIMDGRDGEHAKPWQYARSNTIPDFASRSMLGVLQTVLP